jgi:hypothetical protein
VSEVYVFDTAWEEIVNWFVVQPLYGQILVLIGVIAVLALAVVIVYYVLKGVAYLVYYILKGVYYLLKGLGLLFYKIFEGLYYVISGKPKPGTQQQQLQPQYSAPIVQKTPVQKTIQSVHSEVSFCSECGNKFTDSMIRTLSEKNTAYCIHCGKGYQANSIGIEG